MKATLTSVSQYCDADALIGLITSQSEIEVNEEASKKVAVSNLSDTDGLVLFDNEKVDLSKSEPSESIFKRDEVFTLIPKIKRIDKRQLKVWPVVFLFWLKEIFDICSRKKREIQLHYIKC